VWGAIRALLVLVLFALPACLEEPATPSRTPAADEGNAVDHPRPEVILLVSIDTLRADHLGAYGHERFTSPVLDGLAAEGALFLDASSTAPWTLPAHASMLTGLTPRSHGAVTASAGLTEGTRTLAGLLGDAGWHTAAVVNSTWLKRESFGATREFEDYEWVAEIGTKRTPTTWVTDRAIEWLRDRGDRPLFVFAHYYDVHSDYASLPEYERLFVTPYEGDADGTAWQLLRANIEPAYIEHCRDDFDPEVCTLGHVGNTLVVDGNTERKRFDADDLRHLQELYDAGIRQLDTELGRLIGFLREQELLDRTLLVVTSDHGEEFGEHGRMDHYLTQYQEVLHVPLIVRGPGVPAGVRIGTPVSIVDIAPTLLAQAGISPPAAMEGHDLSPLWRGEPAEAAAERFIYGQASGGLGWTPVIEGIFPIFESVRQGRFKLVHEINTDDYALYDLERDPGERVDVADAAPEIARRLRTELERVRAADEAPTGREVELHPEELERLRALGYTLP
jgi:arylsulfatase A-like enzyme